MVAMDVSAYRCKPALEKRITNNSEPRIVCASNQKHIHFSHEVTIRFVPTRLEYLDKDLGRDLWYTTADFETFKKAGRVLAKKVNLRGFARPVQETHRKVHNRALSLSDEDILAEYLKNEFGSLGTDAQEFCEIQFKGCSSCRGIEHWLSKDIFSSRIKLRKEACKAVVGSWRKGDSLQIIGDRSAAHSRTNRILARIAGLADSQFQVPFSLYPVLRRSIMDSYELDDERAVPLCVGLYQDDEESTSSSAVDDSTSSSVVDDWSESTREVDSLRLLLLPRHYCFRVTEVLECSVTMPRKFEGPNFPVCRYKY